MEGFLECVVRRSMGNPLIQQHNIYDNCPIHYNNSFVFIAAPSSRYNTDYEDPTFDSLTSKMCLPGYEDTRERTGEYLADDNVRDAIHVHKPARERPYIGCQIPMNDFKVSPNINKPNFNMVKNPTKAEWRILLYDGDADINASVQTGMMVADELGHKQLGGYRAWYFTDPSTHSEQVGGFVQEYENVTAAFILEAGHETAMYKPQQAFTLTQIYSPKASVTD